MSYNRYTCFHCHSVVEGNEHETMWHGAYVCKQCATEYKTCSDCGLLVKKEKPSVCDACEIESGSSARR